MVDILAIGSHPDDIEHGCGAILAKMADLGKEIVMVDMTLGEKGTSGTPDVRRQECEAAAALIGAKRVFLDFKDCEITDTYEGRLNLVRVIREFKPRLVLAPMWKGEQNHPDHLVTGQMARYACRLARFAKVLPDYPIHWVEGILHYPPPTQDTVDFIIDVTEYIEVWRKMIRAHASQMVTYDYDKRCMRHAAKFGALIDKEYAQGLVQGNPVEIDDVMTVAKGTREI